ncbi:hypothetical protein [Burkholderia glumae]|uniref:hypothetical protein n=1 Tax=Burkholderia glumae TaxID=337 RepID=UPI002150FF22|nr:hypothetical protein [Burkholderia glumae]UVS97103.1 hypothetical protein EFP19_16030 [Burkholderia glumae]
MIPPAYRAPNPDALVPRLGDDDVARQQSLAVIECLDETAPKPPPLPRTGRLGHGDTPTLADCCPISQTYDARCFGLELAPYPTLVRNYDPAMTLDAFHAAPPPAAWQARAGPGRAVRKTGRRRFSRAARRRIPRR